MPSEMGKANLILYKKYNRRGASCSEEVSNRTHPGVGLGLAFMPAMSCILTSKGAIKGLLMSKGVAGLGWEHQG